jgi:hypothetical protein
MHSIPLQIPADQVRPSALAERNPEFKSSPASCIQVGLEGGSGRSCCRSAGTGPATLWLRRPHFYAGGTS